MKEYLIKTERAEGSSYDDYSTFRNPNEKLAKEIAAFKVDETKFVAGFPQEEWTIVEYDNDEVKCQKGRDIKYFNIADVKRELAEKLLEERNKAFPPYKLFKEVFGIVSCYRKHDHGHYLTRIDFQDDTTTKEFFNTAASVNFAGPEYTYEFEMMHDEIRLKFRKGYSSFNLFFDGDGNFVNRDYNCKLSAFKCEDVNPKKITDSFERKIKSLGDLGYSHGKYYSETHCYIPYYYERDKELGVQTIKSDDDGRSFKKYGQARIKRPKKLEKRTGADLLESIYKMAPEGYINQFRLEMEPHLLSQEQQ